MLWFKRSLYTLLAIIGLLMALIAYILVFVDPNDFKQQLQKVASEQADVRLRLDGDIRWSFFPWLGLELADIGVALGQEPELVRFSKAEFGLAIMPLLQQTIQVDRLRLIDLRADLEVNEVGVSNWQRPTVDTSSTAIPATITPATPAPAPTSTSQPLVLPAIQLDELLLENAVLNYRDVPNDRQIKATVNVALTNVRWDQAWPLLMDLAVEQSRLNGADKVTANASIGADLTVFPDRQALSLSQLTLQTQVEAAFLPLSPWPATLSLSQLDVDIPQENLLLTDLDLSSQGINVQASMQAFEILSAPKFDGTVRLTSFNLKSLLAKLSLPLPEMRDESALTALAMSAAFKGDTQQVMLTPLTITLDGVDVVTTAKLDLAPLYWDVMVQASRLDVDRYLPPPSDTPVVDAEPEAVVTSEPEAQLIPIELIRGLNGRVQLALQDIRVLNLSLDSLVLQSTQANGLVHILPLDAQFYQGELNLEASLDVRQDTPIIALQTRLDGVQIQPLLTDFMDLDKLAGATYVTGDLSMRGHTVTDLMRQLNGDLLVEIKDGALVGMNLTKTVCEGIAFTRSESLATSAWGKDTPFERLAFPARIVNGDVSTPGLTISALGLQVTGDGVISLPNATLDYQANVGIGGSDLDKACRVPQKLTNLAFPIVCRGHFTDDPAGLCRPDVGGFSKMFESLAKAELQAKLDAEKARLAAKIAEEKARLDAKLAVEKAKLAEETAKLEAKLAVEKAQAEAKKQQLQRQLEAEKAATQAKLEAEKARVEAQEAQLKAEIEAKKRAQEAELKQDLEDKLKTNLKGLF